MEIFFKRFKLYSRNGKLKNLNKNETIEKDFHKKLSSNGWYAINF